MKRVRLWKISGKNYCGIEMWVGFSPRLRRPSDPLEPEAPGLPPPPPRRHVADTAQLSVPGDLAPPACIYGYKDRRLPISEKTISPL
jgi:hypothetical protein